LFKLHNKLTETYNSSDIFIDLANIKEINITIILSYHTYIPWIHKFVMPTTGCGISREDTEHTDNCSNNKTRTTQKQNVVIVEVLITWRKKMSRLFLILRRKFSAKLNFTSSYMTLRSGRK
jgi:hypothetical protein